MESAAAIFSLVATKHFGACKTPFMRMSLPFANRGYDLRLIQDYLGHCDPKHTVHYTCVAAGRFEGLWR